MTRDSVDRLTRRAFLSRTAAAAAGLAIGGVGREAMAAATRSHPTGRSAATGWGLIGRREPRPPALRDHTLVLDAAGGHLYLFGGRGTISGVATAGLWRFRLRTGEWKRLRPDGPAPDARFGHNAAWDEERGRLVVYMGQRSNGSFLNDVWAFDSGTRTWKRLGADAPRSPAIRYGAGGGYDRTKDRVFLTHGFTFRGRFDDTWAFDLEIERWRRIPTEGAIPLERCLLRSAWDGKSGQLLLFGGQSNPEPYRDDFWTLDLSDGRWRKRVLDPHPGPRNFYGAAFDARSRLWYVHGGSTPDGAEDDLWSYAPQRNLWYRRFQPRPRPSARSGHDIVVDRDRLWLYGGSNGGDELWRFDIAGPS